jgi:hypothetical protein
VWLVRIRPATSHTSDASYWDEQLINSTNVAVFVKSLNGGPWILSAGGNRNVNLKQTRPRDFADALHNYLERASSLYRFCFGRDGFATTSSLWASWASRSCAIIARGRRISSVGLGSVRVLVSMLRSIYWVPGVEGVYVTPISVYVLTSRLQTRFRAGGAGCERNIMRSMVFLSIVWRINPQ